MVGQRITRRQKDISRLLRERKFKTQPRQKKNCTNFDTTKSKIDDLTVQINKMDEAIKAMKFDPAKVVGKQAVAPTPRKEEKK